MITEQDLHEYNKWLMEVWNPNQLYIPFAIDAPRAFLDHRSKVKKLSKADVIKSVCELHEWKGGDESNLCDCGKGDGTCKREQTVL